MKDFPFAGALLLVVLLFLVGSVAVAGQARQAAPPHSGWLEPWVVMDKAVPEDGVIRDTLEFDWVIQDREGKTSSVSGIAKEGNKVNKNGYYFATAELQKMVEAAQEGIKAGKIVGVASDYDHSGGVPNVSIKFTRLWMDGDMLRFEGDIIDTTSGQNLRTVLKSGVSVGMSTVIQSAKYSYTEAKNVDSSYPYPNQEVLVLEQLTLRRIDPVLNPADDKGSVKADNQNQPPKEPSMTLEELKAKHPELYKQALEDARKAAEATNSTKALEDEIARLKAKDEAREKDDLERSRKGLVKAALDEAKLPKLGKTESGLDLDARFQQRLEDAAVAAKDDKAATDAIGELIAERKAMLGVKTSKTGREIPAGDSQAMLQEAGKEQSKLSDAARAEVNSLRRF